MKAAVVESFDRAPRYGDFELPAAGPGEQRVTVLAAGVSQLSRGQAAGRHYSSAGGPPFVPGSDGVGRLDDGRRVYFAFPRHPFGSMNVAPRLARPEIARSYGLSLTSFETWARHQRGMA